MLGIPRTLLCCLSLLITNVPLISAQNVTVPVSPATQTADSFLYTRTGPGWMDNGTVIAAGAPCGAWTATAGDTLSLVFNGTSVYVIGDLTTTTEAGVQVTLDGVEMRKNTDEAGFCNQLVVSSTGLASVRHTLGMTVQPGSWPTLLPPLIVSRIDFEPFPTPAPSSPSTTGPASATLTSPPTTAPSSASVGSTSKRKTKAIIVGITVGAAAALALLAFLQSDNLRYLLVSLWSALFGWWLIGRRRVIIRCDAETSIVFFLSPSRQISDSTYANENEKPLVWQRRTAGRVRRRVAMFCPIDPVDETKPQTKIGFGSVIDTGNRFRSEFYAPAPSIWDGNAFMEPGGEPPQEASAQTETNEGSQQETITKTEDLTLRNNGTTPVSAVIGTYDKSIGRVAFHPFLHIEKIEPGGTYDRASNELYFHAFKAHHDEAKVGYHSSTLIADLEKENLTWEGGIRLSDLGPVSHWEIISRDNKPLLRLVKGGQQDRNSD